MSNWYDSEKDVLRRQDQAHQMSRTMPLPDDQNAQPSLLRRFLNWVSRKPRLESGGDRQRKPVPRAGH